VKSGVPRIALIHATALAVEPIQAAFERHWPAAMRMNLLDDSLSVDLAAVGNLQASMVQRFVDLAQYAKRTGCTGILFTCSAFGAAIEAVAAQIGLPTLKPNEAMFEEALARSPVQSARLGLIATFEASIPSMSAELLELAKAGGRTIELQTCFVPEAMQDLAQGRAEMHHAKIAKAALKLRDCDVIMLAQFSMAAAQPAVQAGQSSPVLSSPDCAVQSLMKTMNHEP
jgi:aspartate/glutamate racemase